MMNDERKKEPSSDSSFIVHRSSFSMDEPIGLLAGAGRFPLAFAEKARRLGRPVVCVGLRHEASPELRGLVHRFYWSGVARLGRTIRCFKRAGVRRLVMAGKVHKATFLYRPWRVVSLLPDWRTVRAIARAGELCRGGGFVVVKVAKPHQDMRFDVPTVGCATVEAMRRAGGRVLAIEAGRTIVLDQEQTAALADRHGISVVVLD